MENPKLDPEEIQSDELSPAEVKEICGEISARYAGETHQLSQYATKESAARRQQDAEELRPIQRYNFEKNPFERDTRRILFTKAFERLARKTQACTTPISDHVTTRLLHSARMANMSKSAAFALGYNRDLAEAIATGHDIGHTPLGHKGEPLVTVALKAVRKDALGVLGVFKHNIQSLHVVDRLEARTGYQKSTGLNLTDQVRHGILSHDGELDATRSAPDPNLQNHPEAIQVDIKEYLAKIIEASNVNDDPEKALAHVNQNVHIKPATIEAAIVRMMDVLHAMPEDFEDMISLKVIQRHDLPVEISSVLGNDSASMMNRLFGDLIVHSYDKNEVRYSEKVGQALNKLKREFLYPQYKKVNAWVQESGSDPRVRFHDTDLQARMNYLFETYMEALKNPLKHKKSSIL